MPSQSSAVIGPSTSPRFLLNMSDVRENARYQYQIRIVNALNLSDETEPREFGTFWVLYDDVDTSIVYLQQPQMC